MSDTPARTAPHWWLRIPAALLIGLASLWAAGAIWVDGPLGMQGGNLWLAAAWLAVVAILLWRVRRPGLRVASWGALFLAVLIPWLRIAPSNDRDWKPDWAETQWIEMEDGILTVHNFRDFDYAPDGTVTERWGVRRFDLARLRGLDYFHDAFGGDMLAHPIISFDFGPDGHLALSVETRREMDEGYSTVGGFYKMFELQYLWGDERDLIRVRSNVREEPVYLYRTVLSPLTTLHVLLDAVRVTNQLHAHPRFYDTLWANCTTSLRAQTPEWRRVPFDIRMLANGRLDELVFEQGGLVTEATDFEALRAGAFINPVAQAAHDDPAFSRRIREGRPEF